MYRHTLPEVIRKRSRLGILQSPLIGMLVHHRLAPSQLEYTKINPHEYNVLMHNESDPWGDFEQTATIVNNQ